MSEYPSKQHPPPEQTPIPKRFTLHGVSQHAACVNWLKNYKGKTIVVNIDPYVPDHTDSQRGYFHVLCKILGDDLGYSVEDIKRLVKKDLWGADLITVGKIEIEIYKSMAKGKANKLDYMDAIESVQRMGAEMGVYLPEPEFNRGE